MGVTWEVWEIWIIWLVVACLLGLGEMHQGGFYLVLFAMGGRAGEHRRSTRSRRGTVCDRVPGASSGIVFATLRPVARRHRRMPPSIRTGAAALVGKRALVLERIANEEGVGCVRIDSEVWTARSYDEDEVIDAGERVEVVEIRGATALVMQAPTTKKANKGNAHGRSNSRRNCAPVRARRGSAHNSRDSQAQRGWLSVWVGIAARWSRA